MSTRISSQSPRVSFADRGRQSTQESDFDEFPRSGKFGRRGQKSGAQGEFSGNYDKQGHHLKSDGTPDMRFKENREEFEGEGFEYTSQGNRGQRSSMSQGRQRQSGGRSQQRQSEGKSQQRQQGGKSRSKGKSQQRRGKSQGRRKSKTQTEHTKSDGTPDMRFKENRDQFSGEGYENTTTRSSTNRFSKANAGIYEGNVPGEHSGKFDEEGHHLKNDGTPDMRFKENRDKFSGEGYETQNGRRTPRYQLDEDTFDKKIYYRRRRPPTPYALYIREKAPEMKKEDPDMDMNEVFRELGRQWREELSDKEKQQYYDEYEKEVKRYEELESSQHIQHRGSLAMRRMAQKRGIKIDLNYSGKRGKFSGGRSRFDRETQDYDEEEEEDEEEDYTPDDDYREGITA